MSTGYFAQVENGIVQQVRKASAERVAAHPELYPGEWVAIANMGQFPAIGYTHDSTYGFRPPQPFPSWQWDELQFWVAPVLVPDDEQNYFWNESTLSWEVQP